MLNLPGINDAQYYTGSTASTESLNRADAQMRNLLRVGGQLFDMAINAAQINEAVATGQASRASVEGLYGNILGDNGRVIRTSMEGVSDMASDAWEALKNWIKEMVRKVQDFFLKYSVFIKRTKESLKKLKSHLDSRVGREKGKLQFRLDGESFKDKWSDERILSLTALQNLASAGSNAFTNNLETLVTKSDARMSSTVANGYDSSELKLKLDDKIEEILDKWTDTDDSTAGVKLLDASGVINPNKKTPENKTAATNYVKAYYKFADYIIKAKENVVKDYEKAYKQADKLKGRFMGMKASSLQNARQTLHQSLLALFKISSAFRKSASKLNKFLAAALQVGSEDEAAAASTGGSPERGTRRPAPDTDEEGPFDPLRDMRY